MSFYYKSKYRFSYHALNRIRERLSLNHLNDLGLQSYCEKLINEASDVIITSKHKYVRINNIDLYFIIENNQNLVKTISPLSASKLLQVIEDDD